jgi:hypothetical protein
MAVRRVREVAIDCRTQRRAVAPATPQRALHDYDGMFECASMARSNFLEHWRQR